MEDSPVHETHQISKPEVLATAQPAQVTAPSQKTFYTTTRPTDIITPYSKMQENGVEFGAPDKRSVKLFNTLSVSISLIPASGIPWLLTGYAFPLNSARLGENCNGSKPDCWLADFPFVSGPHRGPLGTVLIETSTGILLVYMTFGLGVSVPCYHVGLGYCFVVFNVMKDV